MNRYKTLGTRKKTDSEVLKKCLRCIRVCFTRYTLKFALNKPFSRKIEVMEMPSKRCKK